MRIIKPVNNQVLVRRRAPTKTAGGLHIPDAARTNDQTFEGEVLAVGPGRFTDHYANPDYICEPPPEILATNPDDRSELQRSLVVPKFAPMPCKPGDLVITTRNGTELGDDLWLFCDHEILATVTGGN